METVLGWVCAYTPEEVFMAMGIRSYRLCGGERGRPFAAPAGQPLPAGPPERGRRPPGKPPAGALPPEPGRMLRSRAWWRRHPATPWFTWPTPYSTPGGNGHFFVHLLDLPRTFGRRGRSRLPGVRRRALAGLGRTPERLLRNSLGRCTVSGRHRTAPAAGTATAAGDLTGCAGNSRSVSGGTPPGSGH